MATKPTTTPAETTSIRLAADLRQLIELHGHGELAVGLRNLVARHHQVMRQSLPALGLEQAKAVCGALKGYPLWADPEIQGRMALGPALAHEVHDYQWAEAEEAKQWQMDKAGWAALEILLAALPDVQVLALAYAVEAFFADRETDTDAVIRRLFRIE
jgi:hypothetical protein